MQVKYLGPSRSVNIAPFGAHYRDEIKDYPDDFAAELLETSHKQQFEPAGGDPVIAIARPLKSMKIDELRGLAGKLEIDFDENANRSALISLITSATAISGDED